MLNLRKLFKKEKPPVFTDVLKDRTKTFIAGHRGWSAAYPENTLVGFRAALEKDIDAIHFDVNLTADKRLVVIHDDTVDRTTNGSGAVNSMTFSEIRTLDAGSHKSSEFSGEKIPSLEEICELVLSHPYLLVVINIQNHTTETVDLIIEMISLYGFLERCLFACSDAAILYYIHERYALRTQGYRSAAMKNFVPGKKGTYSHLFAAGLTMEELSPESVYEFEKHDIIPWCYCPKDERDIYLSNICGARMLICEDISFALELLYPEDLENTENAK